MSNEQQTASFPDWQNAPYWAQWFAIDMSGDSHWFEEQPFFRGNDVSWRNDGGSMYEPYVSGFVNFLYPDWKNSLQKRPE